VSDFEKEFAATVFYRNNGKTFVLCQKVSSGGIDWPDAVPLGDKVNAGTTQYVHESNIRLYLQKSLGLAIMPQQLKYVTSYAAEGMKRDFELDFLIRLELNPEQFSSIRVSETQFWVELQELPLKTNIKAVGLFATALWTPDTLCVSFMP
jgi:hypothetical protein